MSRARGWSQRGVTLVETIVALVILSIAVPSTLWAIRDASVQRVAPLQSSTARWLVTEKLEDIIADRHAPGRGYGYLANANYPAEPAVPGFASFSRSTSIVETGPTLSGPGTGCKLVTVTVGWRDARGVQRDLAVTTVVTDY